MSYKTFYIIVCVLSFSQISLSQIEEDRIVGLVTFVTTQNVYVQFENTEEVVEGDTLYRYNIDQWEPCLIVIRKSRTSTVCHPVYDCQVKKDDSVSSFGRPNQQTEEILQDTPPVEIEQVSVQRRTSENRNREGYQESIKGRVSIASYSTLSSNVDNRHSSVARLNVNARHINDSRLSIMSTLNYRRNFPIEELDNERQNSFFRVFNLAMVYDANPDLKVTLGRRINNNFSSLGAIDGLQLEKTIKQFRAGVIVGSRPDIEDHGFNPGLLEYGAFIGLTSAYGKSYHRTTLGVLEQRNSGSIDRRYMYFQHTSQPHRKINLFSSLEVDIYSRTGSVTGVQPRVTNLYLSARYRVGRALSFSLSYDSRKRVIYYETFRSEVERLLEDEARQGLRLSANFRPLKNVYSRVNYSIRYQNNKDNKSKNINGSLGVSTIPWIGGRIGLTYNSNESNYLKSEVYSYRYQRNITDEFSADVYFRDVSYQYFYNDWSDGQKYIGMNLNYRMTRELSFHLLVERANRTNENNHRINAKVMNRF